MGQALLVLQEVSKYYVNGRNVVAGLNKVSLSFERGEFVAITGESGSGKSTLAQILGGILPYEDGEMWLAGKPTSHFDSADWERYRAGSVGFISQSYGIIPGATVEENVISALRFGGLSAEQAKIEALEILRQVELEHLSSRRAAKLSSGQKQRLSIARALAKPCDLLIADEPTGNLDPENSEKVIALLAKAARDRLVILITHEYSECENYVTRHISLQDGRLSADARIRPHIAEERPLRQRVSQKLSRYTAGIQMRSRPVWCAIVLLFLTMTAFAVFAFLGTFIVALDDTSTKIYDDTAFLNGDDKRIVAVRLDGQPMTQEDYDTILSVRYVEKLERFGYCSDISYAWQEGVDHEIRYTTYDVSTSRRPEYVDMETTVFLTTDQFFCTVPLYADGRAFLSQGRLPEKFDEVVASDPALLGKTLTIHLWNSQMWGSDGFISVEFSVVGITDVEEGIFFHEDVARSLTMNFLGAEITPIPMYEDVPSRLKYVNYKDSWSQRKYGSACLPFRTDCEPAAGSTLKQLSDEEIYISFRDYLSILETNPAGDYDYVYKTGYQGYRVSGLHESTLPGVVSVNAGLYERLIAESGLGAGDQVSITIRDYAYTDRVLQDLEEAGYFALSPYVLGSAQVDRELASQRMQTLYICIGALIALLILQIMVLKALFGMENPVYRTMSDMGLDRITAQRSLYWQVGILSLAAEILAVGLIFLAAALGIQRISSITKYLYGLWWVVIGLIHLLSTALAGWIMAISLKRKVYPRSAAVVDLQIEDEEAEV